MLCEIHGLDLEEMEWNREILENYWKNISIM